jgi:SlyX protein
MTPETLEQIEIKIAFLERANAELSDVVYQQRKEIDELHGRIAGLTARMDAGAGQERAYSLEEEKPPHY